METENGKKYEFSFLLKIGESDAELEKIITDFGAKIVNKPAIREIELSYPIKKNRSAQFGVYILEAEDGNIIAEISSALSLKDFVLRYLFVKVPKERAKKVKKDKAKPTLEKKEVIKSDSLTNEKLEETLEEILK